MRTLIIITLAIIGAITSLNTQNVPISTGSKLTQQEAQEALDFHNKARADVNVPGLKWSVELAEYAQEWANYLAYNYNCNIQHRRQLKKQTRKDTGENIFWGGGKSYTSLDASKSWYSEIEQYTYRKITNQNYYNTGHYTQMIWKNTKYVGIGIAICPDGNTIVVGNYSPPGNYTGQYPY